MLLLVSALVQKLGAIHLPKSLRDFKKKFKNSPHNDHFTFLKIISPYNYYVIIIFHR